MIQKQMVTVWQHDDQTEVLQKKGKDRYFIPLGFTSTEILRSLGAAISDALKADSEPKPSSGSLAQGAHPTIGFGN